MLAKLLCTKRKSASAPRCLRCLGATIDIVNSITRTANRSGQGGIFASMFTKGQHRGHGDHWPWRLTGNCCNIKTYSRKAMQHSFITQEDRYGKAIRTFYTQDQASKKPLMALAAYSGTTVSQVTQRLAGLTRDILGRDFLLVADKEWYCGQLIQERHAQYGVAVLTPVKSSPKRLEEFDAVPLEQYDQTIWGNVAAVYTTMT